MIIFFNSTKSPCISEKLSANTSTYIQVGQNIIAFSHIKTKSKDEKVATPWSTASTLTVNALKSVCIFDIQTAF